MNIKLVRSDEIYRKIMNSPIDKRDDIYRYEMMKPFEYNWDCLNVPLKAKIPGGYDVVMASGMLGVLIPSEVNEKHIDKINLISDNSIWKECEKTVLKSFDSFTSSGLKLQVENYVFSLLLADPENPYVKLNDGYSGFGGIPGYIFVSLVPNDFTISRIQAALAHECNHNARFQFFKWNPNISLAEMMIAEGLAENFATNMFGEEMIGTWVSSTNEYTLREKVIPVIKNGLELTGFENITAYLYGDEIAELKGYFPVGLPYCAGYACGYSMIKYYLKKTGKTIVEATATSSEEIMEETKDFWE